MDMIMWIKTNGLAQPMYLVKMKDKPECPVMMDDIPYEIKSAGNLNIFKNKLNNWLNS